MLIRMTPLKSFVSEGRSGGGRPIFTPEPLYSSSCSGTIAGNGRRGVDDYPEIMERQSSERPLTCRNYSSLGPIGVFVARRNTPNYFAGMPYRDPAVLTELEVLEGTKSDPCLELAADMTASFKLMTILEGVKIAANRKIPAEDIADTLAEFGNKREIDTILTHPKMPLSRAQQIIAAMACRDGAAEELIEELSNNLILTDPVVPGNLLIGMMKNCWERLVRSINKAFDDSMTLYKGPFSFDISEPFNY